MKLPVRGYEGRYEVSDDGHVHSLLTGRPLKAWRSTTVAKDRHLRVALHGGGGRGDQKTWLVHQLVAEAFLPPKPSPEHEIRHRDGDHLNNAASNLEWATRSVNTFDQVRDGVHNNARKTHCKQGHEFTPENTLLRARGGRACRTCQRESQRRWRAARG